MKTVEVRPSMTSHYVNVDLCIHLTSIIVLVFTQLVFSSPLGNHLRCVYLTVFTLSLSVTIFSFYCSPLTSCETAVPPAWPVETEGTGRTGPEPGISGVRMADPGGCEIGGGGPWPCHTRSASLLSLCATQSEEEKRG